jgi:hypothetical protein
LSAVPAGVFDAFGWCDSDVLEWRRPDAPLDLETPLARADGATWLGRMVFVLRADGHAPCEFLPRELARLHAPGLGLDGELALAPYGIDDATDELYGRRIRPRDAMWLGADSLNALFWGLHDWAHFHNHGAFMTGEQRAWTELQCDVTALAWLWRNRGAVGIDRARFRCVREEAREITRARFEEEGIAFEERARDAFEGLEVE